MVKYPVCFILFAPYSCMERMGIGHKCPPTIQENGANERTENGANEIGGGNRSLSLFKRVNFYSAIILYLVLLLQIVTGYVLWKPELAFSLLGGLVSPGLAYHLHVFILTPVLIFLFLIHTSIVLYFRFERRRWVAFLILLPGWIIGIAALGIYFFSFAF